MGRARSEGSGPRLGPSPDRRERPLTDRRALACRLPLAGRLTLAGLLAVAVAAGTPARSAPRDTAPPARRDDGFADRCAPPLKLAAGACVRDCPAGYRDTGLGTCRFQRMGD